MKINKKKLAYLAFFLLSISIISYTFFTIFTFDKKNNKNPIQDKEEDYKYLIKEDDGKIKIFENGIKEPIDILDKEIECLPEYDQNMLKNGIYAYCTSDLNKILEDYED